MISQSIRVPLILHPADEPKRTPGIHLSGILKTMGTKAGWLKKRDDEDDLGLLSRTCDPFMVGDNALLMRAIVGHAWEAWLKKAGLMNYFPGFHTPGELQCQGILCSLDGLSLAPEDLAEWVEPGEYLVHEGKATWKYAKEPAVDSVLWMYQICGYLYAVSDHLQEPVTKAIIHPLHVRRDGGIDPIYLPQLIIFEPLEITTAWNSIVAFKHLADPEKDYSEDMIEGWRKAVAESGALVRHFDNTRSQQE